MNLDQIAQIVSESSLVHWYDFVADEALEKLKVYDLP